MIVIKWHGAYLIRDGVVQDSFVFTEDTREKILLSVSSGDLSVLDEFLSKYPGEEIVIRGDLKNTETLKTLLVNITQEKMRSAIGEDYILVQTLAAYDDIVTMLNLMSERLLELEKIEAITGQELNEAKEIRDTYEKMHELRNFLAEQVESRVNEIAPNIGAVVGPVIAARIISYAGGLNRLAKMPASTVQVLGAEDAFFQHLKKGTPCPKHGIIFQVPSIRNLSPKKRGRAARALAGKIAIAARVDYYHGKFIGDTLKNEFEKRLEEIKNDSGRKGR